MAQVTLTINVSEIIKEPQASVVEAYFRGQQTALKSCEVLNYNRCDWDRMIATVISAIVRNQYEGNGEGNYGVVDVITTRGKIK